MMISPETFVEEYAHAGYQELLKLKNDLVQHIVDFESDYDMKDPGWNMDPSPDVHYQWNLAALSKVADMLQKAFNEEYEWGEKTITDFYRDMKECSR